MKPNLYLDNGYVDIKSILDFAKQKNTPFVFITGGRGTGKTFSTLKYMIDQKSLFVYLRRKQTQVDIINKNDFSPFKPIARMIKKEIISNPVTKFNAGFYFAEYDTEKEKFIPTGDAICYTAALTTIANLRSIGIVDDCKYLVYDEFIPEKHENALKNEAMAFLNCYETINRNRELNGGEPLMCVCLANAMDIGNAIFAELKLIDIADKMELKDMSYFVDSERGILMIRLAHSPISTLKKKSALYRMTEGTSFYDMSVQNYFAFEEKGKVKNFPISEFILDCRMGDIFIYHHKSSNFYYAAQKQSGKPRKVYLDTAIERQRFRAERMDILGAYMFNELFFDRYGTELKFKAYIN